MEEIRYVLGVDLGTTTVKVCVIDARTRNKVVEHSQVTKARIEVANPRNEQCPQKILSALQYCLSAIERKYLNNVVSIGVCGQMHGVVLWKRNAWRYDLSNEKFVLNKEAVSTLITWQDQRCSEEFLKTLPKRSSVKFIEPCSGFGCATMLWLLQKGQTLHDFDYAGTIQDLVVAMLTGREKPVMTAQNAASFGYFDPETNHWDLQALALTDFPCYVLPEIVAENRAVGRLKYFWFGIPARTIVFPATGDTQCSVLSGLYGREGSALLHMGTSAQISFVVDQRDQKQTKHCTFFPYFNGKYLCVAASLNGGNVLTQFVGMIWSWLHDLGLSLPESEIWDRLFTSNSLRKEQEQESTSPLMHLRIQPLIFGERHRPHARGSVTGIGEQFPTLHDTFRAICASLIDNLIDMLPLQLLQDRGISRIVCAGKVINHNQVLISEVQRIFKDFTIEFVSQCDSAHGAALGAALFS